MREIRLASLPTMFGGLLSVLGGCSPRPLRFNLLVGFSKDKVLNRRERCEQPQRTQSYFGSNPLDEMVQAIALAVYPTPSFCKSWRNCSAFCIWMTCIPKRAALSRFKGRSSIKQLSSGGLCVISRARW